MNLQQRIELVKTTVIEFFKEKSLMHGAALAYYALLALVPIIYLSTTYGGMIVGNDVVSNTISTVLYEWIGVDDSSGIMSFMDSIDFKKGSALLQVVGIIALLFSCTAILNSLRRSLNEFYDIDASDVARRKKIIRNLLSRLVAMVFVLGASVLMVVLYFAETLFLSLSNELFENSKYLNSLALVIIHHGLPLASNLILFTFIFKYVHDGKVKWKYAVRGALVTSLLLYVGQLLIKQYLMNYFFGANGGVAGTMLVILVWVYYSSQIIFFGAKYIAILSRMKGFPIKYRD